MQELLFCRVKQTAEEVFSNPRQSLFEIPDQIVGMLKPNRQSHQAVPHIHRDPLFWGEALMGRGGGMGYKTFRIAEIVGNADQVQGVEETKGFGLAAFEGQGHDSGPAPHLLGDQGGLRMMAAVGIDQSFELGMGCERIGNALRRLRLALDAQGERLQSF